MKFFMSLKQNIEIDSKVKRQSQLEISIKQIEMLLKLIDKFNFLKYKEPPQTEKKKEKIEDEDKILIELIKYSLTIPINASEDWLSITILEDK
jgi:hypothetical protein